jgi:tetratricopeptide (TPR) repeat protein
MNTNRLHIDLEINQAISFALHGQIDKSISQVEQAYEGNLFLRDGFACIGNVYVERCQYKMALKLYDRDRFLDRLSPPYRQIFAYLLAQNNKTAQAKVEVFRAVSEDPSLLYGYLLVNRDTGKSQFGNYALEVMSQVDAKKSRTSHLLLQANHFAQQGQFDKAEGKVEEAYKTSVNILDGYAIIGNIHRAFARYDQALRYYEIDSKLNRISPYSRIIFANLLTQIHRFTEADSEVSIAYSEDAKLRDGFAMIGSVYRNISDYDKALHYYERDYILNRLSPPFRHIFADQLMRAGRLDEAVAEVESAYAEDQLLYNGYARLGNILRGKSEFDTALKFYELDHRSNRLTPNHRAIYAELLSQKGRLEAIQEIETVYANDSYLLDGYARCAWQLFWPKKDYDKVIEYCESDQNSNKLSPAWMLNLAQAYAAIGEIKKAFGLVEKAYLINPNLKDGYARCAWQLFWPKKDYDKVIEYCESDQNSNKLSPAWMLNLAQAYAAIGEIKKAFGLVEKAYLINPNLKDGNARCAWQFFWPKKDYDKVIEYCESDQNNNRLSPAWMLNLAQAFFASGEANMAFTLVSRASASDPSLTESNGYNVLFAYLAKQVRDLSNRVNALEYENTFIKNAISPAPLMDSKFTIDKWLDSARNMHGGQRCFILGTGPSLNKVDLSMLRNKILFGVNGTYKLPNINLTYFTYVSDWYWKYHVEGIQTVRCQRRFIPAQYGELESDTPTSWLNVLRPRYQTLDGQLLPEPSHFSLEPGKYIYAGGTVLFLCLQLAFYMGFSEVILLGVDHSYGKDDEKAKQQAGTQLLASEHKNAHFDNQYVPQDTKYHVDLNAMERGYHIAHKIFSDAGKVILNASPGTRLDVFPIVSFRDLF